MKTCDGLSHLLLDLILISSFAGFQAQKVEVKSEVTTYLGQEVILPCHFIPGSQNFKIIQFQWYLVSPEGSKRNIAVFNEKLGVHIDESPLKERVNLTEHSLKIKDVKITDKGFYTCSFITFPDGSFEETTKLFVSEGEPGPIHEKQTQMSAGILSAIVISAVLLLVILTAAAYLTYIKRQNAAHRLQVHIDTQSRVASVTRPSYIFKDPEVVYADVRPKQLRASVNKKPKTAARTEEVEYAEVKVYHQRPDMETVFSV